MQSPSTPERAVENLPKKNYHHRLLVSALCLAAVFLISLVTYAPPSNDAWYEGAILAFTVLSSSFACIFLLPVLVYGRGEQRVSAVVLVIFSGYYAYKGWEAVIVDYVINR